MKINERGRGKFKPVPNLSINEVRAVLLKKINEENSRIIESISDHEILEKDEFKEDKFNIVSLFSGCGGLDLGFELSGLAAVIGEKAALEAFKSKEKYDSVRSKSIYNITYSNDLFKEANQTYKLNFPEAVIHHEKDIRNVKYFPKSNLVLGGFPCPGFSEAGPRLIDDERNFLYLHFIRCLLQTQPEFFVAENVKGMMTLGKGEVLKQIKQDFESAGYHVECELLNARNYNVPQIRQRVILVGVRSDLRHIYKHPLPTHGKDLSLKPYPTLQDAIGDLRENPGPYFTGDFSTIYMSRNRKKGWDEQSFTIQASGRQAPLHPDGPSMLKIDKDKWELPGDPSIHRRLSVKEIARIQTFPDWFEFSDGGNLNSSMNGRLDKIYAQIGNAVPVMLAKAVAEPITEWAFKYLQEKRFRECTKKANRVKAI